MARKPNYNFERRERERMKAEKVAEKARLRQEAKDSARVKEDDQEVVTDEKAPTQP